MAKPFLQSLLILMGILIGCPLAFSANVSKSQPVWASPKSTAYSNYKSLKSDPKLPYSSNIQHLHDSYEQRSSIDCSALTADALLAQCPSDNEVQRIRHDFNITFDKSLADKGLVVPWTCTNGGNESSVMLSVYNTFRLMECIPFQENFSWAPEYHNLYEWLKSVDLKEISYFWADDQNPFSNALNKKINIEANFLGNNITRQVINPQAGGGLIDHLGLIAHEARHADTNIRHNCGSNDTTLEYGGAWAVQYHLLKMLANNTGDYFSSYEKEMLNGEAEEIYNTRFCYYNSGS